MTRWVVAVGAAVTVTTFCLSGHVTAGAVAGVAGLWLASRCSRHQAGEDRSFSTDQRRTIFQRDGGRCVYCSARVHYESECPFNGCPSCFEVDHVLAWADGGRTTLANGVTACRRDNRAKSDRDVDEFLADP